LRLDDAENVVAILLADVSGGQRRDSGVPIE
jgi:hypothetical protein